MLKFGSKAPFLVTYTVYHAMLPAIASAFFRCAFSFYLFLRIKALNHVLHHSPKTAFVGSCTVPSFSPSLQQPSTMLRRGLTTGPQMSADLKSTVKKLIDENQVMVFSKTYCPYCNKVKSLKISTVFYVILSDNADI